MTVASDVSDYSRREALSDFCESLMHVTVGTIIISIAHTILILSFSAFWRATEKSSLQERTLQWICDVITPIAYCIVALLKMFCQLVSIFIYPLARENMDNLQKIVEHFLEKLDTRFNELAPTPIAPAAIAPAA